MVFDPDEDLTLDALLVKVWPSLSLGARWRIQDEADAKGVHVMDVMKEILDQALPSRQRDA